MRISARELLGQLFDMHSFMSWDRPPDTVAATPHYDEELRKAAETAGTDGIGAHR